MPKMCEIEYERSNKLENRQDHAFTKGNGWLDGLRDDGKVGKQTAKLLYAWKDIGFFPPHFIYEQTMYTWLHIIVYKCVYVCLKSPEMLK